MVGYLAQCPAHDALLHHMRVQRKFLQKLLDHTAFPPHYSSCTESIVISSASSPQVSQSFLASSIPQVIPPKSPCAIILCTFSSASSSLVARTETLVVRVSVRTRVTSYRGIYSSNSSTATMVMFKASRKQRALALVSATRGKCARTCWCTFVGVASPASQNLRPSAKNACAAASASSGVTEINSALSSCKPWSWAMARSPAYWIKSRPWIFVIHRERSGGPWRGPPVSSGSMPPSVCWIDCWTASRCVHARCVRYPLQEHFITVPLANT